MHKWVRLVATAMAIAGIAVLPTAVLAAPAPFEGLEVTCPGYGETVLTAPGNGDYTPGFFPDENALLVPYTVAYTVTTDAGSLSVTTSKGAPLPDAAITCTFDTTFSIGGTRYTLVGFLTGMVRGQP
jgi:hypothetical protein